MPLEDILTMPSIDSDGVYEPWEHGGCTFANSTVRNAICYKRLDQEKKRSYYRAIQRCMRRDQINAVPIHIGRAAGMVSAYGVELPDEIDPDQLMMGNGHHRVLIAINLHLTALRWTDNRLQSGW